MHLQACVVGAEAESPLRHVQRAGKLLDPGIPYLRDGTHIDLLCLDRLEQREIESEQGVDPASGQRQIEVEPAHQFEARMVHQGEGIVQRSLRLDHHRHSRCRRVDVAYDSAPSARIGLRDAATAHRDVQRIPGEERGAVDTRHRRHRPQVMDARIREFE